MKEEEYIETKVIKPISQKDVDLAVENDLKIWVIGTTEKSFETFNKYIAGYPFTVNFLDYPEVYCKFITEEKHEGENIEYLSKFLNEFTAMYYIWKNNIKSKYVGFCHYRRVIPLEYINYEDLSKGCIQYFSFMRNHDLNTHYAIKEVKQHKYETFYKIFYEEYGHIDMLYNDLEEYLDSQNIIDPAQLQEYTKFKSWVAPSHVVREIYVCSWEEFDKLMQFVWGYINHIITKYDLTTYEKFLKFYDENIVDELRKNWNNDNSLVQSFIYEHNHDTHKKMKSHEPNGNWWRIYGYMLEVIIGTYIMNRKTTGKKLIEDFYVNRSEQYETCLIKFLKEVVKNKYSNILFNDALPSLLKDIHYYQQTSDYPVHLHFYRNTTIPIEIFHYNKSVDILSKIRNYFDLFLENNKVKNINLLNDNSIDACFINNADSIDNEVVNYDILINKLADSCVLSIVNMQNNDCPLFNKIREKYKECKIKQCSQANYLIIAKNKKGEE